MMDLVGTTRRHDVTFRRDGRIDISARAARLLGMEAGDVAGVCHEGGDFYLYVARKGEVARGRHRCRCHSSAAGGGARNLRLNSVAIARRMLRESGARQVAAYWCGEAVEHVGGIKMLPIITRINVLEEYDKGY